MAKVFVIGIDGAPPEWVFGEWLKELPTIKKLMENGSYAKLNSTIPPLSAVAWSSITTGKSPSDLGLFEYIYRKNYDYKDIRVISSQNVNEKKIWEISSENEKKSIICFIPLTWPIKPFDGILVSGYMTPGTEVKYTYPEEIKEKISELFNGKFCILNEDYRDVSKEGLIKKSYEITEMHFELMKYFLKNKEWNLFFGVIDESDAMNHNFLKYCDKGHRGYDPNSPFKDALKEYYKYLDKKIGELIRILEKDTKIILLSDHGIMRMHNRVNLSDWLINEGYLVLKEKLIEKKKLSMDMVDWKKTKVFAIGAYEGQIFINLKGREPEGSVDKKEVPDLLIELEEKLKKITGDRSEKLDTKVFIKNRDYNGKKIEIAPEMIIYFDNLQYGCNTSLVGNKTLWSPQTAKGSDDAGHSRQGIFIINDGEKRNIGEVDILDVAPTILKGLGINKPKDMAGKVIF